MSEYHQPLITDSRSYESEDGDVLPLEIMTDPVLPRPDFSEYMMIPVPDEELDGPVIRSVKKALAAQALEDAIADSYVQHEHEHEHEFKHLSPRDALNKLHDHNNFYPRYVEEKGYALAILARTEDAPYPVLRYLYDVDRKHRSYAPESDHHDKALHSIVGKFESYAVQADSETRFSRDFTINMNRKKPLDDQKFSDIVTFEEFGNDEGTRRTLTSVVRLIEAELFAIEGKGKYPIAARNGVDSLEKSDRDAYVYATIGAMDFKDVTAYNEKLLAEQNQRFNYWRTQLQEARIRASVSEHVDSALAKLDGLRPRAAS